MENAYDELLPSHYVLDNVISSGKFHITKRCTNVNNKKKFAAKIIFLNLMHESTGLTEEDVDQEIHIRQLLDHSNIVKVFECYKLADKVLIISELTTGLDLCTEIAKKVNSDFLYNESVVSFYLRQVLDGLVYIHKLNIVHRNLKPQNMVLASNSDTASVKITGFEFAFRLPDDESSILSESVGTQDYMAPEMMYKQPHGYPVDVWSFGVTLYFLLIGKLPFDGTVTENDFHTLFSLPCDLSDHAKGLLQKTLQYHPQTRITAEELLQEPWFNDPCVAGRVHLQASVNHLKVLHQANSNGILKLSAGDHFARIADSLQFVDDNESVSFLRSYVTNQRTNALYKVWQALEHDRKTLKKKTLKPCAMQTVTELTESLSECLQTSPVKKLKMLLDEPHVKGLLQSHDDAIRKMSTEKVKEKESVESNNVVRVRLVKFYRKPNESLGITMKLNEKKQCVVARVIHGGMIHRQGTLAVGDRICEVNGVNVNSQTSAELQNILTTAIGDVCLKVIPNQRRPTVEQKKIYIKCLFDYDPFLDELIPCQQAGILFKCGDILEIKSKNDPNWWQAVKHDESHVVAGLIPSTELQEKRLQNRSNDVESKENKYSCILQWRKKQTTLSNYMARLNSAFDSLSLNAYEEVACSPTFNRKSLVLLGANGIGRRHIKSSLVALYPTRFASPIHYSSCDQADAGKGDSTWCYSPEEEMLKDINNHLYLEYGQHQGYLYGTKFDSIRQAIHEGKMPVMDVETPALKLLRCKEFSPYIVFISTPKTYPPSGDSEMDTSLQRLISGTNEMQHLYGHLFDHVVVNYSVQDTVEEIVAHIQSRETTCDWLPASWLY